MKFVYERIESTASPLYIVKAIDENECVDMQWQIACDDESNLETVAQEAYALAKAPKTY